MIFTTSWDDGYSQDLHVATLLRKYDLRGTFYVSPVPQQNQRMLSEEEIRTLSEDFEIGSHSVTHPRLGRMVAHEVLRELRESKQWIERVTDKPCRSFSYPKGDVNADTPTFVREAGYVGARTVQQYCFTSVDAFACPASLYLTAFPWRKEWWPMKKLLDPLAPLRVAMRPLGALGIHPWDCTSWLSMGKKLLVAGMQKNGMFFHLFGHSWHLDRYGMWDELESLLKFAKEMGVTPMTNGELFTLIQSQTSKAKT